MVDDVQARAAKLLSEHSRTSGMAVSMGWTCRCGHWCENINDATGHQTAMLRAAGLLAPPSPRARTRRVALVRVGQSTMHWAPRGTTRRGSARPAPNRCGPTARAHRRAQLGAGGPGKC